MHSDQMVERAVSQSSSTGLTLMLLAAGCGSPATPIASPVAHPEVTVFAATTTSLPRSGTSSIGGYTVRWEVAFDENVIAEIQPSAKGIVALLGAGHLARFDPKTLAMTALRIGPENVTALGKGAGDTLLAGLSDGRIVAVDPIDLSLTDVHKVTFEPTWVGGDAAVTVALGKFYSRGRRRLSPESPIWWSAHAPVAISTTTDWLPTTAFLDSKHRLWLGREKSEGQPDKLAVFDGAEGHAPLLIQEAASGSNSPHGFFERDEEVFAYGGHAHIGFGNAALLRVSPRPLEELFPRAPGPPDEGPRWPIGGMVETGAGDFLVAAGCTLWRVDSAFQQWKKAASLGECGFDAARAVSMADGSLFVSSGGEGIVRWSATEELKTSRQPAQIEAKWIRSIVPSDAGLLFFGGSDIARRTANGWEDPQGPRVHGCRILDSDFLVRADGAVIRYGHEQPHGCRVERWHPDRRELLSTSSESCPLVGSFFATPDGASWRETGGGIDRMTPTGWKRVVPDLHGRSFYALRAVGGAGPPWLMVSDVQPWVEWDGENDLWRLDPAAGTLKAQVVWDDEGALRVFDALPWQDEAFLLATDRGLRLLGANSHGETTDARIVAPDNVQRLARDGAGRVWLGGDGLALIDLDGKIAYLGALPGSGSRRVNVLVPDPDQPNGVVAAFDRSVLFVSAVP